MLREALFKTAKHSVIFGLGRLMSRVVGLILIPIYTRFISPSEYGILAIILMVGSMVVISLEMGLNTAVFRYYFKFTEEKKRILVISNVFFYILVLGMVITAILIFASESISSLFLKTPYYAPYFVLMLVTMYLRVLKNVPLAVLRAREKSIIYSMLSILDLIAGIVLNIYFVVILKRGVMGILEAGFIVGVITTPLFLIFIRRDIYLHISRNLLAKLLKFGLPLVPANMAILVLTLSGRYFLTVFSSLKQVGLYALGQKLGLIISILLVQPFQLIWPTMMYSVSGEKHANVYYSRILTYFLIIIGGVALILSAFSKEFTALIASPDYLRAYKVIPFIAFSYVAYGTYFIVSVGINLKEKTYYLPWIVGSTAVLNLILNYILIPQFGMMGAALSSFISYINLAIINYFVNKKLYKIEYDFRRIGILSLIFVVTVALFSLSVIKAPVLKMVYCAIYFALVWFFLLDRKEKRVIANFIRFRKQIQTSK